MDAWDRSDVFDFYRGVLIHQDRIKKLMKDAKQPPHANNRV